MDTLRSMMEDGRYDEAWTRLLAMARRTSDYGDFLTLCRWHKRLSKQAERAPSRKSIRIALLGGATTDMLEAPLKLAVEARGIACAMHHAPYNLFAGEMLDAESGTAQFKPDVAVLVNTPHNMPLWPKTGDSLDRVKELVEEAVDYWLGLCERFHEHTQCEIVLNTFHAMPVRPMGNLGAKLPWEANNFLRRVNLALGERAPAYVHLNDVDGLASQFGVRNWFDTRYWHHAKQPVSFECLVPYVQNTARIIGALFGVSAKCLVLDLDNTLWGGVVGDDGVQGIKIGEGNAVGEAFKAFQQYARSLKDRGILLAVCSKNEEVNARAPFRDLPEMVLKEDDFLVFKANWDPKPDNLRAIAQELNIGTDALVFVDDNPAEREIVRQWMPEVHVVELTEDPADYPRLLDDAGLFEITALSGEDMQRVAQYKSNALRKQLNATVTDYDAYLRSLEQKAVIRPWEEKHLDRITQLINKSNQFNLTTLRLTRSEVEARMKDPDTLTAYVSVADRFGDNGLISVFSAKLVAPDALDIELWLMSCRVLKRGVEQLLCNYIVERARAMGVTRIHGVYLPTAKNGLVKELYPSLGFASATNGQSEATHWELEVDGYRPFDVQIAAVDSY